MHNVAVPGLEVWLTLQDIPMSERHLSPWLHCLAPIKEKVLKKRCTDFANAEKEGASGGD